MLVFSLGLLLVGLLLYYIIYLGEKLAASLRAQGMDKRYVALQTQKFYTWSLIAVGFTLLFGATAVWVLAHLRT